MMRLKGCRKCGGDLIREVDPQTGPQWDCVQCGQVYYPTSPLPRPLDAQESQPVAPIGGYHAGPRRRAVEGDARRATRYDSPSRRASAALHALLNAGVTEDEIRRAVSRYTNAIIFHRWRDAGLVPGALLPELESLAERKGVALERRPAQ